MASDRLLVAAVLGAERAARLLGAGERIEAGVCPVVEHGLEDALDQRRRESLGVVELRSAVMVVEAAGEEIDRAVVIHGPDDRVEVHDAVEEAPRDVALERAQKPVDGQHVVPLRPRDVGKVLVAVEAKAAEREAPVAVRVGLDRTDLGDGLDGLAHCASLRGAVWQMSAQRSTVSAPTIVCSRTTPGRAAWN